MLYQITLTREHRTKPTQMENDILSRFREASSLCGIFYYEGYVVKICQYGKILTGLRQSSLS